MKLVLRVKLNINMYFFKKKKRVYYYEECNLCVYLKEGYILKIKGKRKVIKKIGWLKDMDSKKIFI